MKTKIKEVFRFCNFFYKPKVLLVISLAFCCFILFPGSVSSQFPRNDINEPQDDIEKFKNLGLISFSLKYFLSDNAKNIVFRIRNNTTRSITNIHAWIYEVTKDNKGKKQIYRLLNNPNNGGLVVDGGMHKPGTIENWRFYLISAVKNNMNAEYTLRISQRGVFFAKVEPFKKSEPLENPKN